LETPGLVPIPDPSLLTTQQLFREISTLKQQFDVGINSLRELHNEKFNSIQLQFSDRDIAIKAALDASNAAFGEQNKASDRAILKSEAAVTKQIDAIVQMISTGAKSNEDKLAVVAKGVDDKFQDVKDRLTRIEGMAVGKSESKTDQQSNTMAIVAIVSVIVAVASLIFSAVHH
jgi:hypothetical protein